MSAWIHKPKKRGGACTKKPFVRATRITCTCKPLHLRGGSGAYTRCVLTQVDDASLIATQRGIGGAPSPCLVTFEGTAADSTILFMFL